MSSVRPVTYTLNTTQAVRTCRLPWIQMGLRVGGEGSRERHGRDIRRPERSENRVVCYVAEECKDRKKNRRSGKLRSPHQTWWPGGPNVEVTRYSVCASVCITENMSVARCSSCCWLEHSSHSQICYRVPREERATHPRCHCQEHQPAIFLSTNIWPPISDPNMTHMLGVTDLSINQINEHWKVFLQKNYKIFLKMCY